MHLDREQDAREAHDRKLAAWRSANRAAMGLPPLPPYVAPKPPLKPTVVPRTAPVAPTQVRAMPTSAVARTPVASVLAPAKQAARAASAARAEEERKTALAEVDENARQEAAAAHLRAYGSDSTWDSSPEATRRRREGKAAADAILAARRLVSPSAHRTQST